MTNMCTAFALFQVSGTNSWGSRVSGVSTMRQLIAQSVPTKGGITCNNVTDLGSVLRIPLYTHLLSTLSLTHCTKPCSWYSFVNSFPCCKEHIQIITLPTPYFTEKEREACSRIRNSICNIWLIWAFWTLAAGPNLKILGSPSCQYSNYKILPWSISPNSSFTSQELL